MATASKHLDDTQRRFNRYVSEGVSAMDAVHELTACCAYLCHIMGVRDTYAIVQHAADVVIAPQLSLDGERKERRIA
jgi:hypothetical protein